MRIITDIPLVNIVMEQPIAVGTAHVQQVLVEVHNAIVLLGFLARLAVLAMPITTIILLAHIVLQLQIAAEMVFA